MTEPNETPAGKIESSCGRVTATVRRSILVGDDWLTVTAGLDLPAGAAQDEIEEARGLLRVLLQACWESADRFLSSVLPNVARRATASQLADIIRFMDRLGMTADELQEEVLALGLPWPERGLDEVSFTTAAALLETLSRRLETNPPVPPTAPGPPKGVEQSSAAAPSPATPPITMDGVAAVPVEQLGDLVVHWGKRPEMGGWKGKRLRELPLETLAFLAGLDSDGWCPSPHPQTGKIDPRDQVLQAAARRYYEHLVRQKQ